MDDYLCIQQRKIDFLELVHKCFPRGKIPEDTANFFVSDPTQILQIVPMMVSHIQHHQTPHEHHWRGTRKATKDQEKKIIEFIEQYWVDGVFPPEAVEFFRSQPAMLQNVLLMMLVRLSRSFGMAGLPEWFKYFGKITDEPDFNPNNFPLGEKNENLTEEYKFQRIITGSDALEFFKELGKRPATLRNAANHLLRNGGACPEKTFGVLGAQWVNKQKVAVYPVFTSRGSQLYADLRPLNARVTPHCSFLVEKDP